MPISKHRPPANVVEKFYRDRGMVRESDTIKDANKTVQEGRTERLQARRTAMAAEMASGGVCKAARA